MAGCSGHVNCANCPRYAYHWHDTKVAPILGRRRTAYVQPTFFDALEVSDA